MEPSVATTAESFSLKRGDAKPPISTHPAFPAIVALWFAALLGLGSLVLPIALLERLIAVTGIASLVPSAAPPLGFTAHAAIAVVASVAGSALGLLLARKIAMAHASEAPGRHFGGEDAHPRRPFSAHDELGEEGLAPSFGTAPVVVQKRRSLALSEENRRSTYLEAAPLPGVGTDAPAYLPTPLPDAEAAPAFAQADAREPLELGDFRDLDEGEYDTGEIEGDPALEALRSRIHTPAETAFQDQPMTAPHSSDPSNDRGDAGGRDGFTSLEDFRPGRDALDPLPFAAPSLKRLEPATFDEDEGDEEWEPDLADEDGPQLSIVEYAEPDFTIDAAQAERPLEDLGLVQLAARLGASLKKRKARAAQREPVETALPIAALAPGEDFEAAEAEDAARAMADFFAPGAAVEAPAQSSEPEWHDEEALDEPVVPAPLRCLDLDSEDEADDEALAASFSLPLGAPFAATGEPDEPVDETAEGDDEDGSYSSLLAMKNPFARQQEFVRVEEPVADEVAFEPTVTFPQRPVAKPVDANAPSFRPFDRPASPTNPAASVAPRDPGDAERN
jgi:hypothetical protein